MNNYIALVPIIIMVIYNLHQLSLDDMISFSLDITAALIALLVFKTTQLHRNIVGE